MVFCLTLAKAKKTCYNELMGSEQFYILMLIVSAVIGVFYFVLRSYFKLHFSRRMVKAVAVLGMCLIAAVVFSSFIVKLIYLNRLGQALIGYEYLVSLIILYFLLCVVYGLAPEIEINQKFLTDSLLIFSFLARIGCIVSGCCVGKNIGGITVPIAYLEMLFALVVFIAIRFFKIKDALTFYVFSYSIFRFLTEFLRLNLDVNSYLGLNLRQLLAIVVVVYIMIDEIIKRLAKGEVA